MASLLHEATPTNYVRVREAFLCICIFQVNFEFILSGKVLQYATRVHEIIKGMLPEYTACSCFGLVGQFTELFCMEERPCYLQMRGARMLVLAASTSIQDPRPYVVKMKFHVSVVMATTHWSPCCISDLK